VKPGARFAILIAASAGRNTEWFAKETRMSETPDSNSIPTKMLVPIDFSPSSHTALEMAADLAGHFQAELVLVHVIPMFSSSTLPDFIPEAEFLEKNRAAAESRFAAAKTDLAAKGIKVTSLIEEGNDVASNIMEVVERENIDFLVISTHGLTGWHPLVFGSIAEKVVKLVQCPLLLLRSAKPETSAKVPSGRLMEWW
jgi:nucleotide-binding universal stress UspA family protein